MGVLPGEGRVPYTPLARRRPAYSGEIVVPREAGIAESRPYGGFLKLLCLENCGDERFTVGERRYRRRQMQTLIDLRNL